MKNISLLSLVFLFVCHHGLMAQESYDKHPNTSKPGWANLFNANLSNGIFEKGVWTVSEGVITASKDEALWSEKAYDNFMLDLEFKNADSTNSGVIVHASDIKDWIPHSVEIQIADDYSSEWSKVAPSWQCAAIFGHQAATKRTVKKPGEWNHYTITCVGKKIWVVLNGELVNVCDMSLYTSAKTNPDGTEIPAWLSNPMASLPLHGHIGFQGKHAGAPIYFRNIKIKELK
jgi:3-keto-disaccharide hydrolase